MSSASPSHPSAGFSFSQARSLIGDLKQPNPVIYWIDFLVSIFTGHAAILTMDGLIRRSPDVPWLVPAVIVLYLVTVIAYMRSLMFIHELIHLPKGKFLGFRFAWNALCGILFFVPSFLYYPHVDHHRRKHYGTDHDGEYLALSHNGRWMIVGFIVQALVIPILGLARFLIISPICWFIPGARRWVHRHASTMLVDPTYQRSDAGPGLMRVVVLQEFFCFAWCVFFVCRGQIMFGHWLDQFLLIAYSVGVGLLVLNELRTLGAHRWTNKEGEMTFEEQMLDSINYPNHAWITELWGPIGTRYHALHHLFPSLPYHNLGKAHRRLTEGLPADSPYHRTTADSLTAEILALWRRAAGAKKSNQTSGVDLQHSGSG